MSQPKALDKYVASYINEHSLCSLKDPLLVACSGGVDSMVLLDVLRRLTCTIHVAHCNFGLRGQESHRDERLVKEYCKKYKIPFHAKKFATALYAEEKGVSIEMAARTLRYEWFEQLCREESLIYIVTAHHLDDKVETILFNIIKGTGINGWQALKPKSGNIIRPFLTLEKERLAQYAKHHDILFGEDSSNLLDVYQRNKIRNKILPEFYKINTSYKKAMLQLDEIGQEVRTILDHYIQQTFKQLDGGCGKLSIDTIKSYPSPKLLLMHLLLPLNFHPDIIEQLMHQMGKHSGKQFLSPTHRVLVDRRDLILEPVSSGNFFRIEIKKPGGTIEQGRRCLKWKKVKTHKASNQDTIYVDSDKLKFPLTWRLHQIGDYIYPYGMTGKKKVSDVLTNLKINLWEKQNTHILVDAENRICWVVGIRADRRFQVDEQSKNIWQIQIIDSNV